MLRQSRRHLAAATGRSRSRPAGPAGHARRSPNRSASGRAAVPCGQVGSGSVCGVARGRSGVSSGSDGPALRRAGGRCSAEGAPGGAARAAELEGEIVDVAGPPRHARRSSRRACDGAACCLAHRREAAGRFGRHPVVTVPPAPPGAAGRSPSRPPRRRPVRRIEVEQACFLHVIPHLRCAGYRACKGWKSRDFRSGRDGAVRGLPRWLRPGIETKAQDCATKVYYLYNAPRLRRRFD